MLKKHVDLIKTTQEPKLYKRVVEWYHGDTDNQVEKIAGMLRYMILCG